jgi:hypothetical protein
VGLGYTFLQQRTPGCTLDVATPQALLMRPRPQLRALRLLAGEVGRGRVPLQVLGPKRMIASRHREMDARVSPLATREGLAPLLEASAVVSMCADRHHLVVRLMSYAAAPKRTRANSRSSTAGRRFGDGAASPDRVLCVLVPIAHLRRYA